MRGLSWLDLVRLGATEVVFGGAEVLLRLLGGGAALPIMDGKLV
jgi:hypothetical protein